MAARRSPLVVLVLICSVVVFTGCGGSGGAGASDEDQVKTAVRDYAAALRAKDFDKICDTFTSQVRSRLEKLPQASGGKCPAVLKRLSSPDTFKRVPTNPQFTSVRVTGNKASVMVKDSKGAATLLKQGGKWKLDIGG